MYTGFIVTIQKSKKYISESIQSVLNQTFKIF